MSEFDGWFDAEKVFPERTDVYLIYDEKYGVIVATYCKGIWDDDNREYTHVKAWMELPDRPSFCLT
jgi:hypothetical protein